MHSKQTYVPAAGHDWALPLYDPFVRLMRMDERRSQLIERAELCSGQAVLDLGCGTGTLVVELKGRFPELRVSGVDPDPKALALAANKLAKAGLSAELAEGRGEALPHADQAFDHVFSSFMFHHLGAEEKRATLREVRRVLRPGGVFHMLDFRDEHEHKSLVMRLLHASGAAHKLRGQLESGVEQMMREAGFVDVAVERARILLFGSIGYYRAKAPG